MSQKAVVVALPSQQVSLYLRSERLQQEFLLTFRTRSRQIPFTIRTQETVLSRNKGSIHPLTRDASSLRCNVYPRHRVFISCGPSSSNVMKICPFSTIFKRRRSTIWTISGLQEVVRIYVHNLAANFPATPRWCEDKQYEVLWVFRLIPHLHSLQVFLQPLNLWMILCTNLLLLRRYWAELQK